MIRWIFIILCLSKCGLSAAQLETANWLFAEHAGLSFTNDSVWTVPDGQVDVIAGCASISDREGNLLLYTDGSVIWNTSHQIINNGTDIKGSRGINQNSLFVPFPGADSLIYLFTLYSDTNPELIYSLIDLSGDEEFVIEKNIEICHTGKNRLAAIHHCNRKDFWLVIHASETALFKSFLIDDSGFNPEPVMSECTHTDINNIGPLKFSPDGSRLVVPVNRGEVLAAVYDFDTENGTLKPAMEIYREPYTYVGGLAFSACGSFLYLSTGGYSYALMQFDLRLTDPADFNASKTVLATGNLYGMQLAANDKIYISKMNMPFLDCIHYPGLKGTDCKYETAALDLGGGVAKMRFPDFVQSYLYKPDFSCQRLCAGDTTTFQPTPIRNADSVCWLFRINGVSVFSDEHEVRHVFEEAGDYIVKFKVFRCGNSDSVSKMIRINEKPIPPSIPDTAIYTGEQLEIRVDDEYEAILWNGSSTGSSYIVSRPGVYWLEVFSKGCSASDTFRVNEYEPPLYFPNAFSPDGDGLNDCFGPLSDFDYPFFELNIYNRNGDRVFEGRSIHSEWDGRFEGSTCPAGTYVWLARYSLDGNNSSYVKVKKGTLLLLK